MLISDENEGLMITLLVSGDTMQNVHLWYWQYRSRWEFRTYESTKITIDKWNENARPITIVCWYDAQHIIKNWHNSHSQQNQHCDTVHALIAIVLHLYATSPGQIYQYNHCVFFHANTVRKIHRHFKKNTHLKSHVPSW